MREPSKFRVLDTLLGVSNTLGRVSGPYSHGIRNGLSDIDLTDKTLLSALALLLANSREQIWPFGGQRRAHRNGP